MSEPAHVIPDEGIADFHVRSDGQEFMALYPAPPKTLAVVQNWTALLRR